MIRRVLSVRVEVEVEVEDLAELDRVRRELSREASHVVLVHPSTVHVHHAGTVTRKARP